MIRVLEGFSSEAVQEIRHRLDQVRASGVSVLFAIESGSRAWGFPSPDSDYDCRFVYLRPIEDHLKLRLHRDVIEFPIIGEIDTGGWDLRKALLLALKGNAVISEWVQSPYVYEEIGDFRDRFSRLLSEIVDPTLVAAHYIGLLRNHAYVISDELIQLKKLFYALRPALSLQYLEEFDFRQLPPMNIQMMMQQIRLKPALVECIELLIEKKKITREMGSGPVPELILRYLLDTQERNLTLMARLKSFGRSKHEERHEQAEQFYISEINRNYPALSQ